MFLDNLLIIRTRALLSRAGFPVSVLTTRGAGRLPDWCGAGRRAAEKNKKFPRALLTGGLLYGIV